MKDSGDKGFPVTPMRAASPPRQMERENEMIVISHRLFCCDGFSVSLGKYVR